MKKVITLIIVVTLTLFSISSFAEEPPAEEVNTAVREFNEAQFLLGLEQPKETINMFIYIVDHSSLTVSIDSWNYFVSKMSKFQAAYKASLRGWSIDFDEI